MVVSARTIEGGRYASGRLFSPESSQTTKPLLQAREVAELNESEAQLVRSIRRLTRVAAQTTTSVSTRQTFEGVESMRERKTVVDTNSLLSDAAQELSILRETLGIPRTPDIRKIEIGIVPLIDKGTQKPDPAAMSLINDLCGKVGLPPAY